MKKLLLLLMALLSVILLDAQQSIVIQGKITNCSNPNNASIRKFWFNPSVLEEQMSDTPFQIAEDGTFYVEIPNANEFYAKYWIHLGNEGTLLELIAGDNITMMVNADLFDESIRHTGRGAGRNNYRRDVALQFWHNGATDRVNSSDPNNFLSKLMDLRDRKLELLNKYFASKEIDSSYYHYEKTLIMNEMANLVLINNNTYHHHKYLSASLTRQMEELLKGADYSDERVLNNKESRELIAGLPAYRQEMNSIAHRVDVNRELAFAKAHYSSIMQQFVNKEIMRRYLDQAASRSQKTALLNFFDRQADAPALKEEIQQQRNSLKSNRIINSRLFQSAMIIIVGLVAMVLLIYAIIRLIQYLGKKRIRVDVSLWLKVAFYLAAAFLALAYMSDVNAPLHGFPMVLLMLSTFWVHTYVLISRYALQRHPRYYLLTGAAFIVFAGGNRITNQVSGSLFEFLVLVQLFLGLILLSWISYYIHQMASGKATLKELRKSNDFNLEIAVNLVAVFLINLVFISGGGNRIHPNEVVLFYTILLLLYFHTLYTYPRFFNKEKVLHFIGLNVLIIFLAAVLLIILDTFQSYGALKNIGLATRLSELLSIHNLRPDWLLVFGLLLIPSFIYYYIKNQLTAMESTGFQLYRKKEAELAQLRSQVNPHFLFNTLNTLYAFALKEGSDKTAESIAKLANLMRFMLDDMEKETIPLKREISYIRDYVKLQSIRSAVEHDIVIHVEIPEDEDYAIAPMLMIPFVENAFKHGMNPAKISHLKIDVRARNQQIQLVIENSVDEHFQAYYKEKGFGIGIENVKSRLRHVYPNRHTLSIAKTTSSFIVILNIEV